MLRHHIITLFLIINTYPLCTNTQRISPAEKILNVGIEEISQSLQKEVAQTFLLLHQADAFQKIQIARSVAQQLTEEAQKLDSETLDHFVFDLQAHYLQAFAQKTQQTLPFYTLWYRTLKYWIISEEQSFVKTCVKYIDFYCHFELSHIFENYNKTLLFFANQKNSPIPMIIRFWDEPIAHNELLHLIKKTNQSASIQGEILDEGVTIAEESTAQETSEVVGSSMLVSTAIKLVSAVKKIFLNIADMMSLNVVRTSIEGTMNTILNKVVTTVETAAKDMAEKFETEISKWWSGDIESTAAQDIIGAKGRIKIMWQESKEDFSNQWEQLKNLLLRRPKVQITTNFESNITSELEQATQESGVAEEMNLIKRPPEPKVYDPETDTFRPISEVDESEIPENEKENFKELQIKYNNELKEYYKVVDNSPFKGNTEAYEEAYNKQFQEKVAQYRQARQVQEYNTQEQQWLEQTREKWESDPATEKWMSQFNRSQSEQDLAFQQYLEKNNLNFSNYLKNNNLEVTPYGLTTKTSTEIDLTTGEDFDGKDAFEGKPTLESIREGLRDERLMNYEQKVDAAKNAWAKVNDAKWENIKNTAWYKKPFNLDWYKRGILKMKACWASYSRTYNSLSQNFIEKDVTDDAGNVIGKQKVLDTEGYTWTDRINARYKNSIGGALDKFTKWVGLKEAMEELPGWMQFPANITLIMSVTCGGGLVTTWVSVADQQIYQNLATQQQQMGAVTIQISTQLTSQQLMKQSAAYKAFNLAQSLIGQKRSNEIQLSTFEQEYISQSVATIPAHAIFTVESSEPVGFGQTESTMEIDQRFALSAMLTPENLTINPTFNQPTLGAWCNPFRSGNWQFIPTETSGYFYQTQIVPLAGTTPLEKAQEALYNSIFKDYIPPINSSYFFTVECTILATSEPFLFGVLFNNARWISGVPDQYHQHRFAGIFGTGGKWYQVCTESESSTDPQQPNMQWPAYQILNTPQNYQSNPLSNQTLPAKFTLQITTTPVSATVVLTPQGNNSLINPSTVTQQGFSPFIFNYHGIGFMSAGCTGQFKIVSPETLTYTSLQIQTFQKMINSSSPNSQG